MPSLCTTTKLLAGGCQLVYSFYQCYAIMAAEQARDDAVPTWDGTPATLEHYEEEVLIYNHTYPDDKRKTVGPKLLAKFRQGAADRALGMALLKDGKLQEADGAEALMKMFRATLGKELEQDVSEH